MSMNDFQQAEALEARRLLSSSFASVNSNGTLSVVGTSKNDSIIVQTSGSNVQAILNGATESFSKSAVKRIWIDAFRGNDKITNQTSIYSTLIGSSGNDTLNGGAGRDTLMPGYGDNFINGGSKHDRIDYSDVPAGQFDIDNEDSAVEQLDVSQPGGQDTLVDYHDDRLVATPGNDDISGSLGAPLEMTLAGGAGNDSIGGFLDEVFPAPPQMTWDGDDGNDDFGTSDEEVIPDAIIGGNGDDHVNDDVWLIDSPDAINLGAGHDSVEEIQSQDGLTDRTMYAGPGVEDLTIDDAADFTVIGNDLNNTIEVNGPNNTILGEGGDDRLDAESGNSDSRDLLQGNDGNDTLRGDGAVTMIGGAGRDVADFSNSLDDLSITLDNKANDGFKGQAADVEGDIENIIGGSGNDLITGNPFANRLEGGAGNDTIWGSSGNDTLIGDAGHDQLHGQDGNDVLYGKDGQTDTLDGGAGFDKAQRDNSASIKDQVLSIESFI